MTPTAPFGSRWLLKIVLIRSGKWASELAVPLMNVPSVVMVLRPAVTGPRLLVCGVMPSTGTCSVPPPVLGWVCSTGTICGAADRAVALVLHGQRRSALVGADGVTQLVEGGDRLAADADQLVARQQTGSLGRAGLVGGRAGLRRVVDRQLAGAPITDADVAVGTSSRAMKTSTIARMKCIVEPATRTIARLPAGESPEGPFVVVLGLQLLQRRSSR